MQRNGKIDIIKSLAICGVVLGFCGTLFTIFIYFFDSGCFFGPKTFHDGRNGLYIRKNVTIFT